jgi:ABC-type polysaccharide/polyol phosphate transport system ATPase subunit
MEKEHVIKLKNVSKRYKLYSNKKHQAVEAIFPFMKKYHKDFYSIRDFNLDVAKGDILGVVGRNGCGKSTLMKLVSSVIQPTKGSIEVKGNLVPLLELGSGFHREFTGYENIYFYTAILGYPKSEIKKKAEEIIEFADLGEFIHQPLKNYSSGMKARLAFSVSVMIEPDILILDEVLSVGDAAFKEKSFEKINQFFESRKTILFVSHSMDAIKKLCNRAILIDKGELIMDGKPEEVTKAYKQLVTAKNNTAQVRRELVEQFKSQPKE